MKDKPSARPTKAEYKRTMRDALRRLSQLEQNPSSGKPQSVHNLNRLIEQCRRGMQRIKRPK